MFYGLNLLGFWQRYRYYYVLQRYVTWERLLFWGDTFAMNVITHNKEAPKAQLPGIAQAKGPGNDKQIDLSEIHNDVYFCWLWREVET